MTHMLIAVTAMFLQQTCGSIARALPAVLAPLIIAELHADAAWVGVYFSLTAFAGLIGQLGSGGFIIRHGAIRMSQIALLFTGAGLAVAVLGGAVGFVLSAAGRQIRTPVGLRPPFVAHPAIPPHPDRRALLSSTRGRPLTMSMSDKDRVLLT